MNKSKKLWTVLYADDQVIIAKSEDGLQRAVNELNKVCQKYDMKISIKNKINGLWDKHIQREK